MGFAALSFRLFGPFAEFISKYFIEVKIDLKRARLGFSLQEYLSIAIMISFLVFISQLPLLSFLFGFIFLSFLFSFIFALTISFSTTIFAFLFILNYPKIIISEKTKKIDNSLPFALLFLSTIAGAKLPLHKTFEIFSKFSAYEEMNKQVRDINEDVKVFGLDINTALERSVERSPSKNFKEVLYGILSTIRAGADLPTYLKEKTTTFMTEHRRKLYEFSHTLTIYIEVYLAAIVLGAIFFTILTAIISGISGVAGNIILLQFFLIFVFLPLLSIIFIFFVRSITPGGE